MQKAGVNGIGEKSEGNDPIFTLHGVTPSSTWGDDKQFQKL
jgi:hypothetical protein